MDDARIASSRAALALGITSTLLAVLATVLALRYLRARARLIEDRARLLAERASELENFAGRVAHDLRGPLSAMALRIEASRMRVGEDVQPILERLGERVGDMVTLVDGLYDFAVSGAPASGSADPCEVAMRVAREIEPEVQAAGAQLAVECGPCARTPLSAGALASVLSNLLRNAAKFIGDGSAAPGERKITLRARDDGKQVRFEVEDNGPGIPDELLPRIFQPFVRGERARRAGAGLGLATVERLVTGHGGRVGVVSRVGAGACFWVELPLAPAPSPAPAPDLVNVPT
jgi:signal transduction histidine kinase